ncbi:MAG: MerR family DNA-binding transcriptional regulator [Hydrogenophaga sp.]|nr:MerR family DNA-binding transcriptional regulator [Hydrogenophaga sp.]
MQISQLAAQTGVSVHALRHYEKLGLLLPARRPSGYRDYTEAMRREVVFIAMSRRIGFSLKAIAAQLPAYRSGRLTFEDMLEAMLERITDIDAQIGKLKTQRRAVVEHIAWMKIRQREHLAKKAAQTSTPGKPPWPVVTPSRKRTT